MDVNKLPDAKDLELLRRRMSTQFQIPSAYDDALSYQGLIYKLIRYIQDTQQNVIEWNEYLETFLQTYDENLREVVLAILTSWADDGMFTEIVEEAISDLNQKFETLEQEQQEKFNQFVYEIDQKLKLKKYGDIFIPDITEQDIQGLKDWDINHIYGLYDELLSEQFTKEQIGNGALPNNLPDGNLPIFVYRYRPTNMDSQNYTKPLAILTSGIHGNEKNAIFTLYNFVKNGVLQQGPESFMEFWEHNNVDIIPVINPYGVNKACNVSDEDFDDNIGRDNARGVDLNRNFSPGWDNVRFTNAGTEPESELETQAMVQYFNSIKDKRISAFVDFHTSFNAIENLFSSQLFFQGVSYLYQDQDITQDALAGTKKMLLDEFQIDLNEQKMLFMGMHSVERNGLQVAGFSDITGKRQNVFLFEGGKLYLEENNRLVRNHIKNIQAYIAISHTLLSKLNYADYTTEVYDFFTVKNKEDDWGNAVIQAGIGESTTTKRPGSKIRITLREPILVKPNRRLIAYVPQKGYSVQLIYADKNGIKTGNSSWNKIQSFIPVNETRVYVAIKRDGDEPIYRTEINHSFNTVVKYYDMFSADMLYQ